MKQKIRNFTKTDAFKVLLLVLAWHLMLTFIGVIAEHIIKPVGGSIPLNTTITSHSFRWDSGWYGTITREFYNSGPGHEVFYPLFPFLSVMVHKLSLGLFDIVTSGMIVNVVATFFAALALLNIGDILIKNEKLSWLLVFAFIGFPSAFFMHAFYTEAVFCALGFWAYLWALRRNWMYMAICLAFLSANRITAILFIGLCGLEYLRSRNWNMKKINTSILWFLLAPAGFIAYGLYLLRIKGDFLAMFHAYDAVPDWAYQQLNPNILHTYLRAMNGTFLTLTGQRVIDNGGFANTILPAAGLTLLLVVSIFALIKIRDWAVPLGIFGLASFVFFTLNDNVVSAHRYILPCIVIYLAFAHIVKKRQALLPYAFVTIALLAMSQTLFYIMFISGYFIG